MYQCHAPIDGLLAMYDGKTKTYKGEEWCIDIESANGNLMIAKERVEQAKKSKNEMDKFLKEREMCRVLAQRGNNIEYRKDVKTPGETYDIYMNGIPAELKEIKDGSGAGNIVKKARKALTEQGADIVIFSLPTKMREYREQLLEAHRKYGKQIVIYYRDSKTISVIGEK